MRIFEQIFLQTRQKFAGILSVWQEFLTQYATKFAEKTQIDACEHELLKTAAAPAALTAAAGGRNGRTAADGSAVAAAAGAVLTCKVGRA